MPPLEWAEFPLVVDIFVVASLVAAAVQFLPPFFARGLEYRRRLRPVRRRLPLLQHRFGPFQPIEQYYKATKQAKRGSPSLLDGSEEQNA